jgi:predicted nucleic acid-binding protein
MPVVSNSGPILAFGRADLLHLLKDVLKDIEIPEAVYERNLPLLIDEKLGRQEAARLGIPYFGSLRVVQSAKELGLIPGIKPTLDQMIAAGMYLDDGLYAKILTLARED